MIILMVNKAFENILFNIGLTECKTVGLDWNFKWDKSTYQFNYNRMYYITQGQAVITLVNGKTMTVKPGFIYHLPQNSIVETRCTQAMQQYYIHYYTNSLLYDAFVQSNKNFCIPASKDTLTLFQTVIDCRERHTFQEYLKQYGAFVTILSDFFSGTEMESRAILSFLPLLEFVEANFSKEISIEDMASILGYNSVYFSNKFKKNFSIAPIKYLINRRIQKAHELLITTDLQIHEIAYDCGFMNSNYFNECFKKYYFASPSEYRKKMSVDFNI